jgi:DNA polymerase-1
MSLEGVSVKLLESVDDAQEFKRWLGERRPVLGFDTETTGLTWWGARDAVRLAQFGDAMTGWAIPFERWSGVVEEAFKEYEGPIAGHNTRFDLRFMHHHGIEVDQRLVHDTMLAANALWPNQRLGLKWLATKHIDPAAASGESALTDAMTGGSWNWRTVPVDLPQYWSYGALDTVLTARLHELMQPMLKAEKLEEVYELECAVSQVLYKMETRGARIDVPHCHKQYELLTAYAKDARAYVQDTWGISPTAKDEVIQFLSAQGYNFHKRTPGGSLKLDEDVLSSIQHPVAEMILNVRRAEKLASTYFSNFVDLVDDNGMLHCSVRQVGARTGRMSITDPALQTLPRDNKTVRNAFIPIDPEHRIATIDYDQIEMRIFAHFAGEEEMIRQIRDLGVDLHTAVCRAIYGIPDDQIPPAALRQITKSSNFAKVYGAGAKKFALTAGITEEEGIAFYATYDNTFPRVKMFQRELSDIAHGRFVTEGRAYVRAPSGRLHITDDDSTYKLTNFLVQGTAADVLKQKIVELDLCGFGDYMFLPVHDEILFDFPEDRAVELIAEAAEIMTDRTNFAVPLTVSASPPMEKWTKV